MQTVIFLCSSHVSKNRKNLLRVATHSGRGRYHSEGLTEYAENCLSAYCSGWLPVQTVIFLCSSHVSKNRKNLLRVATHSGEEETDAIQTKHTLQTSRLSGLGSVRTEILCKTPGTASGRGAVSIQTRLQQPMAEGQQGIPADVSVVCYLHETGEIHQSHCGRPHRAAPR